jgi:possible phenylacetate--coA ligase
VTAAEQLVLLQRQIAWAAEKTAFYRDAFARAGVCAGDVHTPADMNRLPLLERAAWEGAGAPFFMLALPLSGLMRMSLLRDSAHERGIFHCCTQEDVARRVRSAAQMLSAAGINRASNVLLVGDFTDSRMLDLQYALDTLGAMTMPIGTDASAADIDRILSVIVPDTVIVWEEFLPPVAAALQEKRIMLHRLVTVGARVMPQEETRAISGNFARGHVHLYTDAVLGALIAGGAIGGIRIDAEQFFAEALDAAGAGHTEDGAAGELVLSTIAAEAMPVLRYRTGRAVRFVRRAASGSTSELYITEG